MKILELVQKIGPFWKNRDKAIIPQMPYQPEFIVLLTKRHQNGTAFLSFADIHSDNNWYFTGTNSSSLVKKKNWFKCNSGKEFLYGTINDAQDICRKLNLSIKTYYSKV